MGKYNWIFMGLILTGIFFIMGLVFAIMKEKACVLISGYNFKSRGEREKYNERRMSTDMRNFLFICSGIFLAGTIATFMLGPICLGLSFVVWLIYFLRDVHIDDEKAFGKYRK